MVDQTAIKKAVELMDENGIDIIGVFEFLCLGENFNRSNETVLSWLPPRILQDVIEWLEQESAEEEEDDDGTL